MSISITILQRALDSLEKGLVRAQKSPSDLEVRDACIQRFEYTYELCIKLIKRYIEQEMPVPEPVDQLNYRDLLRIAYEIGLLRAVEPWFQYREARNQTSHAYDENKAKNVYQCLPDFAQDTHFVLSELGKRLRICK